VLLGATTIRFAAYIDELHDDSKVKNEALMSHMAERSRVDEVLGAGIRQIATLSSYRLGTAATTTTTTTAAHANTSGSYFTYKKTGYVSLGKGFYVVDRLKLLWRHVWSIWDITSGTVAGLLVEITRILSREKPRLRGMREIHDALRQTKHQKVAKSSKRKAKARKSEKALERHMRVDDRYNALRRARLQRQRLKGSKRKSVMVELSSTSCEESASSSVKGVKGVKGAAPLPSNTTAMAKTAAGSKQIQTAASIQDTGKIDIEAGFVKFPYTFRHQRPSKVKAAKKSFAKFDDRRICQPAYLPLSLPISPSLSNTHTLSLPLTHTPSLSL